jgi:hypothetical protein
MLCVHVAGDEPGTLTHDFRQNFFAISVNQCHLDQLNDSSSRVPYVARFSPSRPELSRPLADQLTLQRPPLLLGQIGNRDLEHDSLLIACQKPPTSEACVSHNLLALSTIRFHSDLLGPNMRDLGLRRWAGEIGSSTLTEFAVAIDASPTVRYHTGLIFISINPTRENMAVEEPKRAEHPN